MLFQDAHKEIFFDFQKEHDIPKLNLDSEQIKRVMVNLLDNAVAAINKEDGHIVIRTSYDKIHKKAGVEVADNAVFKESQSEPPTTSSELRSVWSRARRREPARHKELETDRLSCTKGSLSTLPNTPNQSWPHTHRRRHLSLPHTGKDLGERLFEPVESGTG